jgi:hypothetical protein
MDWEQELDNLRKNPKVDSNGTLFLDQLRNRPQLARELVASGRLRVETLRRQRLASEMAEHLVLGQGAEPHQAQRDAEREYLMIPDTEQAPNLNNQANFST